MALQNPKSEAEERMEERQARTGSMPSISENKTTAVDCISDHDLVELRLLGIGGQASVSLCRDTHTGRLLALKTSHGKVRTEEEAGKHFARDIEFSDLHREYETIKMLIESNVPGIVPVHRMCVDDSTEQLCILMDYCDGGSLLSELRSRPFRRLSEVEAITVLSSLAHTLEHCHKLNIMHRDIKPDNILIDRGLGDHGGEPSFTGKKRTREGMKIPYGKEDDECLNACRFFLADFGLASRFRPGHRIRDKRLVGTTEYMAPEMIKGAYDQRADVWSLGVVFHLMLTGYFPFHNPRTPQQGRRCSVILAQTLSCPQKLNMDSPSHMYTHISREARSLLQGMLRKNPRRRITLSAIKSHPCLQSSFSPSSSSSSSASVIGVKRIRIITHEGPSIVRKVYMPALTSSSHITPSKNLLGQNDNGSRPKQQISTVVQPSLLEQQKLMYVPRRPRQRRPHKQLNLPIPLQATAC